MTAMSLACIHAPGDIRLDSVDRPAVGPQDVLVAVQRCGICGSDLSYSKMGGIPGAASPFAIGHEFAGVVEAVGAEVTGLSPGERVVVNPEGAGNGIGSDGYKGAFAPYLLFENVARDPGALQRLPEGLDYEQGRGLIDQLNAEAVTDDLVYTHEWSPRECMVWDNRCLLHRAMGFDTTNEIRVMRRCTTLGETPDDRG